MVSCYLVEHRQPHLARHASHTHTFLTKNDAFGCSRVGSALFEWLSTRDGVLSPSANESRVSINHWRTDTAVTDDARGWWVRTANCKEEWWELNSKQALMEMLVKFGVVSLECGRGESRVRESVWMTKKKNVYSVEFCNKLASASSVTCVMSDAYGDS